MKMTLIENIQQAHDWLKDHKFRDGESIVFARLDEIDAFVDCWYQLIGHYANLTYYAANQEVTVVDTYDSRYWLSAEERNEKVKQTKVTSFFCHDARGLVLELRYGQDQPEFQAKARTIIAALDLYLSQIHEYLKHGQTTYGYFILTYKDNLSRVYQVTSASPLLKPGSKFDFKKCTLVMEFKL